jgi:hypothetical protein
MLEKALEAAGVVAYEIVTKNPAEPDSTDGADAPLKSLSGKSIDAADPAAPEAAGSAASPDEADIELEKLKALALAIEFS